MKKFVFCLSLFLGVSLLCLGVALFIRKPIPIEEPPATLPVKQEPSPPDQIVINQNEVEHISTPEEPPYCLVSEDGFLLVFRREQDDVCLYTHIPITDFPKEEQDRLREGIWFATMMEIYSYLESYTS